MDTKSAMINKIKAFDYYRKIPQDLSEKSMSGGLGTQIFLKKK